MKYIILLIYGITTFFLAYFVQRTDTLPLFAAFAGQIFCYALLCNMSAAQLSEKQILAAAIALRVVWLFAFPNLSDDVYRFLWDGAVAARGIAPFAHTPTALLAAQPTPYLQALYAHLNSPDYYTVYPTVCQAVFWVAARLCPNTMYGAALVLKTFIFAAEIGSLILIKKLLQQLNLPAQNIVFYALNPLVINELVGNTHFEGILIFCLLFAIYILLKNSENLSFLHLILSAFWLSLAICTKLIPLLFLPFLAIFVYQKTKNQGRKYAKAIIYSFTTLFFVFVLLYPLFGAFFVAHFGDSLALYFQKFEFNASLYYVLKAVSVVRYGFNWQTLIVPFLSGLAMVLIAILCFKFVATKATTPNATPLFTYLLAALTVYYVCATTVHPWYLTTAVALSCFVQNRYAVVWSCLILWTYSGYASTPYHENLWLVAAEYIAVLGVAAMELILRART
jgi:alpha-1,6-mannosyltransferase